MLVYKWNSLFNKTMRAQLGIRYRDASWRYWKWRLSEKGFWDAFWAVKSLSHVAGTSETGSPRLPFLRFKYVPGQAWTEAQDLLYNKSNKSKAIEKWKQATGWNVSPRHLFESFHRARLQ